MSGRGPYRKTHRPYGETMAEAFPHILSKVNQGMSIAHACELAGFDPSNVQKWMQSQADATEAAAHAKASADEKLVYGLYAKADDDPRIAQWLLERKRPADFGRAERVEVTGKDGGPIETVQQTRTEAWAELKAAARADTNVLAALVRIVRELEQE